MAADKSHLVDKAYNWGGVLGLPSTKDIVEGAYDWGGVLNLPSARDIVGAVSNSNTNYNNNSNAMGFANAAGGNTSGLLQGELGSSMAFSDAAGQNTGGTVNLQHPAASGTAGLFYDDGIDWANPDLTYDIPPDDMQANYEYEAYGGPRGPDWVFNPNTTTPEPNRTPTTNPSGGGGGGYGGGVAQAAPITQNVLTPQNLFQRTPSGSIYAPDLSAYNDSSLFNYTGPGGVDEYTYGQGLPYQGAGYNIWGSPTDVPNPYFWGQFGQEPQGPADGAVGMSPVEMPAGIPSTNNNPNVGTNTTNITTGGGTGPGGQDLTYQETIDYFGLTPQSTTFPSPPGANPSLAERQREQMGAENWDAMAAQADAWDNQMRQSQVPEGLLDTGAGGKMIVPWVNTKTGQTWNAPHTGFESSNGDWTPAAGNKSTLDADLPELGKEVDDSLVRDVAAGMAKNQQTLMDKGKALQAMYDASEARQRMTESENKLQEMLGEYTPSIRDVTDAKPMNFADTAANAVIKGAVNTQHPAYQARINESENKLQEMLGEDHSYFLQQH